MTEEFEARRSMRFIAGVCWLFYLWEFTDSIPKGRERIMNLQTRGINTLTLSAMLIIAAAVGLALYIFLLRAFWICLYDGCGA